MATKIILPCARNRILPTVELIRSPVLEIGCGSGWYSLWLADNGFTVISLDLSNISLMQSKQFFMRHNFNIPLIKASASNLPFKEEAFASVTCYEVFEHVPNVNAAFKEVHRVLRLSGYLFTSIPNGYGSFGILNDFILNSLGLTPKSIESYHVQKFTTHSLNQLMLSHDFNVTSWSNLELFTPCYIIIMAALRLKIKKFFKLLRIDTKMALNVPLFFGSDWLIICKKAACV